MKPCTVPSCSVPHYAKGLCRLHYKRATEGKYGLAAGVCKQCGSGCSRPQAKFCSVGCKSKWNRCHGCYTDAQILVNRGKCSLCDKPVHANGLCRSHSKKLWKYGDTQDRSPTLQPCKVCRMVVSVQHGKQPYCPQHYHNQYYYRFHTRERARRNARRTRVQIATPAWADHRAIHEFYIACPLGLHVDHVLPLKGKLVSGLHVLENLQYLEPLANRQKLNRFVA